jgi:hypothetical protein
MATALADSEDAPELLTMLQKAGQRLAPFVIKFKK